MAETVKNEVNRYRSEKGMTQEALAEKAGVSRQTIIAIEKGNYTPSVLLAIRLARAFGARVEDLFSLTHDKK
jgi:putative transcriptional regulator